MFKLTAKEPNRGTVVFQASGSTDTVCGSFTEWLRQRAVRSTTLVIEIAETNT